MIAVSGHVTEAVGHVMEVLDRESAVGLDSHQEFLQDLKNLISVSHFVLLYSTTLWAVCCSLHHGQFLGEEISCRCDSNHHLRLLETDLRRGYLLSFRSCDEGWMNSMARMRVDL